MRLSELKEKLEELTKDLPDGADPDILIVDEHRFFDKLKKVSMEIMEFYEDSKKIRTDCLIYLEAE